MSSLNPIALHALRRALARELAMKSSMLGVGLVSWVIAWMAAGTQGLLYLVCVACAGVVWAGLVDQTGLFEKWGMSAGFVTACAILSPLLIVGMTVYGLWLFCAGKPILPAVIATGRIKDLAVNGHNKGYRITLVTGEAFVIAPVGGEFEMQAELSNHRSIFRGRLGEVVLTIV